MNNIEEKFTSKCLSIDQVIEVEKIRENFKNLAIILNLTLPESEEKVITFTKLQEASMWAIKSISNN